MAQGKGKGFERWAKIYNLKQLSMSMDLIKQQGFESYEELTDTISSMARQLDALDAQVRSINSRMAEIAALKQSIYQYVKTKDVYSEWRQSGWSKQFAADHAQDIHAHQDAKKAFDALKGSKVPTIKELSAEYDSLIAQKRACYTEKRGLKGKYRELLTAKANVDLITERELQGGEISKNNRMKSKFLY